MLGEASLWTSCIACAVDKSPAATVKTVDPLIVVRKDGIVRLANCPSGDELAEKWLNESKMLV